MPFKKANEKSNGPSITNTIDVSKENMPLSRDFEQMVDSISSLITSDDMKVIRIESAGLVYYYLETIVDLRRLHDEIIPQFERISTKPDQWKLLLPSGELCGKLGDVLSDLMKGHIIIAHRSWKGQVVSLPLPEIKTRSVEQPTIEKVLLGAKESFVEDLDSNVGLLRRWIKDVNLTVTYFTVGERSKSKVALVYYRDVANPDWVKEITSSIRRIHIDRILGHKDLMELIIGRNQTVFPLYELTEVPVRTSYFLNQGRIAILVDGSPFAALLPTVVVNMLLAAEYLTQGSIIPLFVRIIRLLSLLLALYAPALYVALVSVNTGIIPADLGLVIASDRALIPYPVVVEALALFIVLDIFLESTSFVPGAIGPALNIVGSLVIGQAASQAHLVSRTSIIIAAITAIGTFLTMYQLTYALRIWKYPMILAASMLGLYGIVCCTIVMVGHLCSLKSLGVPYFSPLGPLRIRDLFNGVLWSKDISRTTERMKTWKTIDKKTQDGDSDA